jgi:hypothetical protein
VLEILSRRLWCCGDLDEGWAKETLSLRLQLLESLVEECEVVEEPRPPRRVAKISGFLLCRDEVFCCCSLDPGDRRPCVRHEGDSPMVEEREMAARACSGPRLRRGTSLVKTVHVLKAGFVFLSQVVGGDGVLCRVVSCAFVLCSWVCCVVVSASASYVPIATFS